MSNPVSAMQDAQFRGIISLRDLGAVGMLTLRGDLSSPAFGAAVTATLGVDMPNTNAAQTEGTRTVLWMSPDELMVVLPYDDSASLCDALSGALKDQHALVIDVSDARSVFALEGTGSAIRETLAKLTPADMRATEFPPGQLRRTRLAQVPAAFWFVAETEARVICFRSVAGYAFGVLQNAAAPGSEVGFY